MSEVGLLKSELDTPVLWVNLDTLERNIVTLAAHFDAARVKWRPHTKGIKVPAIAHKALDAGAIGVTCAKLGEAEVMGRAGVRDILIANQIVTHQKITRLVQLRKQVDVKVTVDNAENIVALGTAATTGGVELSVLVDIDSGMNRAGVQPGRPVLELASLVERTNGLRFMGVMSWEGHTINLSPQSVKRREIERSMALVRESVELCEDNGLNCEIVSAGGTSTMEITPFTGVITEIQAGGGIFSDALYRTWTHLTEPALHVRSTVTSRPTPNRIVLDAGFKSLPSAHQVPQPLGLPSVESLKFSAEHGVLTLEEDNHLIQIGDAFDFVIGHADATVFLHDQIYGVRDGVVEVVWPIEGRGKLR